MVTYIDYKYNDKIETYNFLLNIVYFLHFNISYYMSIMYVISFPFIFKYPYDNTIMNIYTLFYSYYLFYFIHDMNTDYKKMLYYDIGFLFIYYINNDFCNIFVTSMFYLLSLSYIIFIISSLCIYYYINKTVIDYIKYYINHDYNKGSVKYINNNNTINIHINSLYEDISNLYNECISIG